MHQFSVQCMGGERDVSGQDNGGGTVPCRQRAVQRTSSLRPASKHLTLYYYYRAEASGEVSSAAVNEYWNRIGGTCALAGMRVSQSAMLAGYQRGSPSDRETGGPWCERGWGAEQTLRPVHLALRDLGRLSKPHQLQGVFQPCL